MIVLLPMSHRYMEPKLCTEAEILRPLLTAIVGIDPLGVGRSLFVSEQSVIALCCFSTMLLGRPSTRLVFYKARRLFPEKPRD